MPAEPHIPEGNQGSVLVFHPGRNYYKLRIVLWFFANLIATIPLTTLLAGALFGRMPPLVHTVWSIVTWILISVFVLSLPLTFFIQRLNYEMRWYIATDRSLRIRRGTIWVEEVTMTFANIQEIRVTVNPLQRVLGLGNVNVHSAGGGRDAHGQSTGHVARFESVDNAAEIRDLMMERLRVYRDSGLGHHSAAELAGGPSRDVDAAHAVLEEVKALRSAMHTLGAS
jgi:membrane protein YdbS with pleckstrin-like domain